MSPNRSKGIPSGSKGYQKELKWTQNETKISDPGPPPLGSLILVPFSLRENGSICFKSNGLISLTGIFPRAIVPIELTEIIPITVMGSIGYGNYG